MPPSIRPFCTMMYTVKSPSVAHPPNAMMATLMLLVMISDDMTGDSSGLNAKFESCKLFLICGGTMSEGIDGVRVGRADPHDGVGHYRAHDREGATQIANRRDRTAKLLTETSRE